jgi:hypothetical protein
MDLKDRLFLDRATGQSLDYDQWYLEQNLHQLFNIERLAAESIDRKLKKDIYTSVDEDNTTPLPPELDDLTRLHFLVRNRRVTTILEFGVGKSTRVLAKGLQQNEAIYGDYVREKLRRGNPFELHTIDNNLKWLEHVREELPDELRPMIHLHYSAVEMTTFNGRACTMYKELPNICPDLIYLDGPDQYSTNGDVRGISTRAVDRLPMAADILLIEPFLLPGTLIVVDGRTANARFLRNNLQREWEYHHFEEEDIHAFELVEAPLGTINAQQLQFCLNR